MRQQREQKQAAPHPTWSTKGHSLILQKQRWLQAPHNTKATYQDHYRDWDTLWKRSAGSTGQPTHQKRDPWALWSSTLIWRNFTGSSRKSQGKEWLSPTNGGFVLGERSSLRHFPPSNTDDKTSDSYLQMETSIYHQNGFCQKTLHKLTVAFAVYSSNNLNSFV